MYFEFGKRELSQTPSFDQLSHLSVSKLPRKKVLLSYSPLKKLGIFQTKDDANSSNLVDDYSANTPETMAEKRHNLNILTKLKPFNRAFLSKKKRSPDSASNVASKTANTISEEVHSKTEFIKARIFIF